MNMKAFMQNKTLTMDGSAADNIKLPIVCENKMGNIKIKILIRIDNDCKYPHTRNY